jgi:hypothetical protein
MRRFSFGIIWSRGRRASILPDSTIASPRSMRLMVPVTSASPRSRKSCRICSRSASRTRCSTTCLVSWAKRRPNSTDSIGSSMYSSTSMSANLVQRFEVQDFLVRQLQAGFVRHDVPAAEGFEFAGVAIDAHADVDLAFIALFRGLRQRELERAEHDLLIDVFFARERINQQQNFATHALRLLKSTFGTSRALSSSASVNSNNAGPSLPSISNRSCRLPGHAGCPSRSCGSRCLASRRAA